MRVGRIISNMSLLLIALLLQTSPLPANLLADGERIALQSKRLILTFSGFTRADMIEIVPVGRQEEPSVRVTSAAIRNLILLNREKSYEVVHRLRGRSDDLSFTPADLRQNSVLIVGVPEGLQLQVLYNGFNIPITGPFKQDVVLSGAPANAPEAVLATLYQRLRNREIFLPPVPPPNPQARLIHSERPGLTVDELRVLNKLEGDGRASISFEAMVTDTGQVIEVRPLSGIPSRLPRGIMQKLEDAAMRHSFQPYLHDGKAEAFTTAIVLELP